MRWKTKTYDPCRPHKWFAWHPVDVAPEGADYSEWVWWEYVIREYKLSWDELIPFYKLLD